MVAGAAGRAAKLGQGSLLANVDIRSGSLRRQMASWHVMEVGHLHRYIPAIRAAVSTKEFQCDRRYPSNG